MNWPPRWVLALCAIPLSIIAMIATAWLMRHGYLSFVHGSRQDKRLIFYGLLAPFLAVLYAIITFFMRDNKPK